jgi:hypothetical protein
MMRRPGTSACLPPLAALLCLLHPACRPLEPEPPSRRAKWSVALGASTGDLTTVGPDNTVYCLDGTGLRALDRDGRTRWRRSLSGIGLCPPVVGGDSTTCLLVQRDGDYHIQLTAVASDGEIKWHRQLLSTSTPHHPGLAMAADNTIYCALDSFLFAVAPDSSLRWQLPLGDCVSCPPTIGRDGTIYVGARQGLIAVAPDGSPGWRHLISEGLDEPPVIAPDNTIYYSNRQGQLAALDPEGNCLWRRQGGLPVIGADQVARFWSGHDTLCELHPDGTSVYRPTERSGCLAVTDDGTTYCTWSGSESIFTTDAGMAALNADGSLRWTFTAVGDHYGAWPPTVGPDGTVYFCTIFNLYAVADSGDTRTCFWPMYRHDAQLTGRAR